LGSRAIIGGDMTFMRIFQILFSWQFILGAIFAFGSRLVFMLINSALYKIPHLSASSTTITTLITTVSLIFVIIANYFFLHEKINPTQMMGALVIILGIFLITR
jgi:drug/metabolite transporter (DMT)-like permease